MWFWERLYHEYYSLGEFPAACNQDNTRDRYSEPLTTLLPILKKSFAEPLRIVDCGSGPITSLFEYLDITGFDITTVDPLAKNYNQLNHKYNVNYSLKCTVGTGETLDQMFPENSHHLSFSRNAVDHSSNPSLFIRNMHHITKPNGFIVIMGFVREGTANGWHGLHKFNLYVVEHDIWVETRDGNRKNLTENLGMQFFSQNVEGEKVGDKFTVIYRKSA